MAGPGREAGANEASGAEDLLSNWTETATWWSHRSVFLKLFLFIHSAQEWDQARWKPKERFLWEIRWDITLLAGCPQNCWVPRGSNHTVSLHGGTATRSLANSLLIHVVKGMSAGLFRAGPLYFNPHCILYEVPKTRTFKSSQKAGELDCHWLMGLGVVLVQQSWNALW